MSTSLSPGIISTGLSAPGKLVMTIEACVETRNRINGVGNTSTSFSSQRCEFGRVEYGSFSWAPISFNRTAAFPTAGENLRIVEVLTGSTS